MKWAVHVAHGEMRNEYIIFVEKREGKRPLGRWEDNIKMHFMEILWNGVDWIHLAQDRDGW
jgi:hypothetical protein